MTAKWTSDGKVQSWEQTRDSARGFHPSPRSVTWLLFRARQGNTFLSFATFTSMVSKPWMIFICVVSWFLINEQFETSVTGPEPLILPSVTLRHSRDYFSASCVYIPLAWATFKQGTCPRSRITTADLDSPGRSPLAGTLWKPLELPEPYQWASALRIQNVGGKVTRRARPHRLTTEARSQATAQNAELTSSWRVWTPLCPRKAVSQALAQGQRKQPMALALLRHSQQVAPGGMELPASWGVTGVLIIDSVCFVYNFLPNKLHVSADV